MNTTNTTNGSDRVGESGLDNTTGDIPTNFA